MLIAYSIMKESKLFFQLLIGSFVFCYLMACIVEASFNPLAWTKEVRIALTITLTVALIISFVGSYIAKVGEGE